ncbi:MAG: type I-E CRISPR-associated protein Cse1/CasA [Eubacteriales bacterium]
MYNVLTEPWIPVRVKNGTVLDMRILDVLDNAPELVEITDQMPNYEFGIYRFLFVFLMDVYKPQNRIDIEDLLDSGQFDMEKIERYIDLCNKDGERFDLLDPFHPFLQCGENEWGQDSKIKSVSNLNPIYPSGNNHVHFDHNYEDDVVMEFKEAAKALCAINLFCTAGAQDYPSTPNGAPPVYSIVKGRNLFETLVFGMVPVSKYNKYDNPAPQWHGNEKVEFKKKVADTSLLYGLMFPCRRIRLLTDNEQNVSSMYFEQGMNYNNYEAWSDPYVTYLYKKDGRSSLKPNIEKENWRNLGSILNCDKNAPEVIGQYMDIAETDHIHIQTYEVVTNNASYLDIGKGEYTMPYELIKSQERFDFVVQALEFAEKIGSALEKNIQSLQKEMGFDAASGITASERKRTVNRYFFNCKQKFFEWVPTLSGIGIEKMNECLNSWKKMLYLTSLREYDTFVERLGGGVKLMMTAERIKSKVYRKEVADYD